MSEKLSSSIEHGAEHVPNTSEALEHGAKNTHEKELSAAEKKHGKHEHLEAQRSVVEKHALLKEEHPKAGEQEKSQSNQPLIASVQLKTVAWTRTMTRTRKKLAAPERVFSKVIHNSVVDKPSEFIGKTVARPSGMLWGSVIAFIGTSALLWITRHYGYEFNYLLVLLLFVVGAFIGTALEGLWYVLKKNKS